MTQTVATMSQDSSQIKKPSALFYYLIQMMQSFALTLSYQFIGIFTRKLGATETQMGILAALQNVTNTFFQPFWGKVSDKYGRRRVLLLGYGVTSTVTLSLAFARTPIEAIIIIGLQGFGISIITPSWNGAISDYTINGNRGSFIGRLSGFGYYYVSVSLTLLAIITPALTLPELTQYRFLIMLSAMNLLGAFIFSLFLTDKRFLKEETSKAKDSFLMAFHDPIFSKVLLFLMIWWFPMSFAWSFFPIVIADKLNMTPAQISIYIIAGTIVQAIVAPRWGKVIDKIGARKAMTIGLLPFSLVPLIFAYSPSWWYLVLGNMLAGIGIGSGFPSLQTYILDAANEEYSGYYYGTYQVSWGIVTFIGSILGGIVLNHVKNSIGLISALVLILTIISIVRMIFTLILLKLPEPKAKLEM